MGMLYSTGFANREATFRWKAGRLAYGSEGSGSAEVMRRIAELLGLSASVASICCRLSIS